MIKGITVQLVVKTANGTDALNHTVYKTETVDVKDVLVGQPSQEEITNTLSLYGKQAKYTLAIPKGDENTWVDTEVILPAPFSGKFKTIGFPIAGIEANIPLRWNKKVLIEQYG